MPGEERYFSDDYRAARGKFLAACEAAGVVPRAHRHPQKGPQGEPLFLEEVWIGPGEAERVLVVCSATHGVEGFVGSAAQTAWLCQGRGKSLPAGVAVLLVHALNPHGFAWLRRVNEANVDLNRNFIDHNGASPENPGYDTLAKAVCPPAIDEASMAAAKAEIEAYRDAHGLTECIKALVSGQYRHADGVYFGGESAAWSNRTFRALLARHVSQARAVAYVDIHSGLGPYGHGAALAGHRYESPGERRLRDWFGPAVSAPGDGNPLSLETTGDTSEAIFEAVPEAETTAVCLEFGTRDEWAVFDAVRRDNWLHLHGDLASANGRAIKAEIRDAFYPDERDWKQQVLARAEQVLDQALAGLSGS